MFQNKTILITGGTGAWGKELTQQLLVRYSPKEIRIYSRGEHGQVKMKQGVNNNSKIRFIVGDVRDKNILNLAMRKVDVVFHLAALKHVPVCEENCWAAVLTNIYGTQNVIEAAIHNKVEKVIGVSSDKAVEPFNFYGITKAAGEKLLVNANQNELSETDFACFRSGNVIATTGSVIPLFKEQLQTKNELTVTDERMTRFLMNTSQVIDLFLKAAEESLGGEIFVAKMPAVQLSTLVQVMVKLFGNSQTKIKKIGPRPGEKMHEILVSKNEIYRTKVLDNELLVILPQYQDKILEQKYENYPELKLAEFNSQNTHLLNEQELEQMIKRG